MSNQLTRRRQSLEAWIQEALTDPDKNGKCTGISLVHKVGTSDQEVHTCKFGGRAITAKGLAELFQGKAESYAQDLVGVQTFNLLAFYGTNEPEARHPFMITSQTQFEGLATEGPDQRGVTQQGMRLTEAIVQNTFRLANNLMANFEARLESQGRENLRLTEENREMFGMMREMLMARTNQQHEQEMARLNYERQSAERAKWLAYLPALVNSVLGREVFPVGTVDTAIVESVALNIKDEDIAKLAGVVPPELMGPLAERMTQIVQKKAAEKAEAERMALAQRMNGSGPTGNA